MFLRNFDNILLLSLGLGGPTIPYTGNSANLYLNSTTSFLDGNLNVKKPDASVGSLRYISRSNEYSNRQAILSLKFDGICLGDGDTEVTYDDYKLSGNVVKNNLVVVSNNTTYDSVTKQYTTTLVASYNNATEETITIKEWGKFTNNFYDSSNYSANGTIINAFSNSDSKSILLTREVLETPVVIEPGETATLTFQLKVGLMHQV